MFLEGLAGKGIRKGTREDIPLEAWLDHVPTLAGEVLTLNCREVFDVPTYGGMLSSCRLDFSDNAKGMAFYRVAIEQPGRYLDGATYRVNQPRLVWEDLQFSTADFLKRQKRSLRTGKPLRRALTRRESLAASKLIKEAGVPMTVERGEKIARAEFPHMGREDARKIARGVIGKVPLGRPKK